MPVGCENSVTLLTWEFTGRWATPQWALPRLGECVLRLVQRVGFAAELEDATRPRTRRYRTAGQGRGRVLTSQTFGLGAVISTFTERESLGDGAGAADGLAAALPRRLLVRSSLRRGRPFRHLADRRLLRGVLGCRLRGRLRASLLSDGALCDRLLRRDPLHRGRPGYGSRDERLLCDDFRRRHLLRRAPRGGWRSAGRFRR